jgi:RecA/RadA recombinase
MPKLKLKTKPRTKLKTKPEDIDTDALIKNGLIKRDNTTNIEFVPSGSTTLNLALSGRANVAYPIGRVINVVGDYSSGKTLLACELVNAIYYILHKKQGKKVRIVYDEPETAFDIDLALNFNMPLAHIIGLREQLIDKAVLREDFELLEWTAEQLKVKLNKKHNSEQMGRALIKALPGKFFEPSRTIEQLFNRVKAEARRADDDNYDVILYVIDSLDMVGDQREIDKIEKDGIEKQDYQGRKGLVLSQLFRNLSQDIKHSNIIFYVVSQIRHNIGAMGAQKKFKRSGGKALDHSASQVVWLHEVGQLKTKSGGLTTGIQVKAIVDKNKVGNRYRTAEFQILHGYGIDDMGSLIDWLRSVKALPVSGSWIKWNGKKLYKNDLIKRAENDPTILEELREMAQEAWDELEREAIQDRRPKWG